MDVVFEMLSSNPALFKDEPEESRRTTEPPWALCIDDDADYSLALKLRLESHGVAVVRAFDGMDGYRCAFSRPADVILLDYELPNGQGDYVLRRLQDNPVTKSLPVIMISGHRDQALERRMMNLGAVKFLHKPLDFAELLAELGKHIEVVSRYAPV